MEKSKLQSFINRYYLAGNCEAVILKEQTDSIGCELIDTDQTIVGKIKWNTAPFMKGMLGINHTGALIKMLGALGENITIDVKDAAGKNYAMKISEGSTQATFMLADTTVIPAVPSINAEPQYEISIPVNEEFVSKFIKAKNALPESENFGVDCKDGKVQFIMNYSSINTNRIKFDIQCDADGCKDMDTVCFSSNLFKEILQANRDADTGKLEVSAAGLARVSFSSQTYTATYYLVQLQTA